MKYFRSKDVVIAALAHMAGGDHKKAGALLVRASQDPEFEQMVEQMNADQEQALQEQQQQAKAKPASALASIIEGMSDVNDIEDLMEDLDHVPDTDIEEPEDVSIDGPDAAGDVDVDVDDEQVETASERVVTAATERLARAQRNAARRK